MKAASLFLLTRNSITVKIKITMQSFICAII